MFLRQTPRGLMLSVKATPKAARQEIAGIRNEALLVKVTAVPEKGKANDAIIALLAKSIGVPKSTFDQVAGETDRNKIFRVVSHLEIVQAWADDLVANHT